MGLFLFFSPLRNNYIKKTKAAACLEVFVYWVCVQCDDEYSDKEQGKSRAKRSLKSVESNRRKVRTKRES